MIYIRGPAPCPPRLKARRAHRSSLSDRAVEVLTETRALFLVLGGSPAWKYSARTPFSRRIGEFLGLALTLVAGRVGMMGEAVAGSRFPER